jgi:hypothetical protein
MRNTRRTILRTRAARSWARDTRIRREVVGQLLDYAANAVVYWPIERLRELFVRECERGGRDPDEPVAEVAGPELEVEAFWERAQANLRSGKLRLVFVCDRIRPELQRVIEFLNGQMSAEVLGIEVKQYAGEDMRTLVPTLVGQTAEAEARKGRSPRRAREWDEQSFFAALAERRPAAEVGVARALYDWAQERGWAQAFGAGLVDGTWLPTFHVGGAAYAPIAVKTYGSILVRFEFLARRPAFEDRQLRLQLLELVNEIPGVSIGVEAVDGFASVPLGYTGRRPGGTRAVQARSGMGRARRRCHSCEVGARAGTLAAPAPTFVGNQFWLRCQNASHPGAGYRPRNRQDGDPIPSDRADRRASRLRCTRSHRCGTDLPGPAGELARATPVER